MCFNQEERYKYTAHDPARLTARADGLQRPDQSRGKDRTMDYAKMKTKLNRPTTYSVKAQTTCGTAVKITKIEACRLLDILERRAVEPNISFTHINDGKYIAIIN